MVKQYQSIKARYSDAILLFRLGDFYEMFGEDAKIASSILNIVLTSRQNLPMCGIPFHSAEPYIKKLLSAGYKVAICEQLEDPTKAKGIVKRDVIRVITPGTYIESESPEEKGFIAVLTPERDLIGAVVADINKGKVFFFEGKRDRIIDELRKFDISTIVIPRNEKIETEETWFIEKLDEQIFKESLAKVYIETYLGTSELFKLRETPLALTSVGVLLYYLKEILLTPIEHITTIEPLGDISKKVLDSYTIKHLELVSNLTDGSTKDTLFHILDRTATPQGKQLLKEIILNPLTTKDEIDKRLKAVEELKKIDLDLKGIGDIERIASRVKLKLAKPKELIQLKESLIKVQTILEKLKEVESELLKQLVENLEVPQNTVKLIEEAIEDIRTDRIIKEGYNCVLDEYRTIKENSEKLLQEFEEKEKKRTGIPSLKVNYNRVFGYYIEITKVHLSKIPPHYIRKQTLAQAERYTTAELKELEEKILSAQGKIEEIEKELFEEVLNKVALDYEKLVKVGKNIALLDVLNSFSKVAKERRYVKPNITNDGNIIIVEGRHPVVELAASKEFIPNDTNLLKAKPIHIITGPNMSGKSTYIRQVALITLMAQIGSFVPAKEAYITPVDRILTRIGTADYLAKGLSTFMVEMKETANIINRATENSLIILDEIGRGTSTYDGLSIAWATIEYIREKIKAKTLFATHYHELTDLANIYPEILNYQVEVKEFKDNVIFTHKVKPGRITKSYGIFVAKLAGLPHEIIERAKTILESLEREREVKVDSLPLYEDDIRSTLRRINLKKITPLEAMMILEELVNKAKK